MQSNRTHCRKSHAIYEWVLSRVSEPCDVSENIPDTIYRTRTHCFIDQVVCICALYTKQSRLDYDYSTLD